MREGKSSRLTLDPWIVDGCSLLSLVCMHYKMRETVFVGSSSNGLDDPMSPPIAINLDRYHLADGRSRLIVRASLKLILNHVL